MSERERETKKQLMIEALKKSLGNIGRAVELAGISRAVHYKWRKEDEQYAAACEEINEISVDFVESKLFELINGVTVTKADGTAYKRPPCKTSIIFYLKSKAKHRGYVERQELTGADGKDLYKTKEEIQEELKRISRKRAQINNE